MEGLKNINEELEKIVELAKINEEEERQTIDAKLGDYADSDIFVDWARENLSNENSGLRDLGASIFERADRDLTSDDITALRNLMREIDDNPYPSFRAACALAKRRKDEEINNFVEEIKNKLQEFIEDASVSEIARNYLNELNKI